MKARIRIYVTLLIFGLVIQILCVQGAKATRDFELKQVTKQVRRG